MDERIERITEMEGRLNRLTAWLETGVGDVAEDARVLDEYYRGPLWRADFEADEAGELPQGLPRGVLSEDAAYLALTDYAERTREAAYREALETIQPGRYRHFKGGEYEVCGVARHSETEEPMVVYRPLYGEGGLWVRPAAMWNEVVERDGVARPRFERVE